MGGVGGDNDSKKGNKTKQKMFILQNSLLVCVRMCRYMGTSCVCVCVCMAIV